MAGWNLEETGILVCVQCAQRWTEPDRSRSVTDAPVVQIMGSFSLFMSQRRRGNLTSPMQQRATPMTMHPISCDVTEEANIIGEGAGGEVSGLRSPSVPLSPLTVIALHGIGEGGRRHQACHYGIAASHSSSTSVVYS